jgi:tetratricopeptide (TPR) repeat protein
LDRWRALGELRSAETQHSRDFPSIFSNELERARNTFDRGERGEAVELWQKLPAVFPDLSMTSCKVLNLALDLGCYDEAEALMQAGSRRYPHHAAYFYSGLARIAYRRGDLVEAIHRCEILRRKFPRTTEGYSVAATCLSDLGRHEEAEAIIGSGVSKIPKDFDLHERYARHATQRREWTVALQRWETVTNRFEHQFLGPLGTARCLREMGRFLEAEEILAETCVRFDMVAWPFAELASLATAKGDFDEAVKRWELVLRRFPSLNSAYTNGADAMRRIGRDVQADELLRVAVSRFQSDLAANLEYARSAHRRGDWPAAMERWALVLARFPECSEAPEEEADARAAVARQCEVVNGRIDEPPATETHT